MAPKYWWQKVPNPDQVVHSASRPVSDARIRYTTALKHAGLFPKEPEIMRGFIDSRVPLALAMRSFQPYQSAKLKSIESAATGAGLSNVSFEPNVASASQTGEEVTRQVEQAVDAGKSNFWDKVLPALGGAANIVGKGFTYVGSNALRTLNAFGQTAIMPTTVGTTTDNPLDQQISLLQRGSSDGLVSGALSAISGITNYAEGAARLATGALDTEQQQDIKRGGGDPNSFSSRFSYYFTDIGEKRTPVSNADVQWLKGLGRFNPADVDAAREIVTSGALDDLVASTPALSPQAQDFLHRVNTDKNSADLLDAMRDTTQTTFGGRLVRQAAPDAEPGGDWFGPGSASRGIASAVADVIATWTAGPEVAVTKLVPLARKTPRYLARVGTADAFDNVTQMMKASDDAFKPVGAVAKRVHQALDTADRFVTVRAGGTPQDIMAAAKIRESWNRVYPGYESTLDLAIQGRLGTAGKLRARTKPEALEDAKRAGEAGVEQRPFMIDMTGDGSPVWRFTDDQGVRLPDEQLALERGKFADYLAEFNILEAAGSGREIIGSKVLLPGQMSLNGKLRDVVAPVLEAFMRRDRSVMKQLRETAPKNVDLNGYLATNEAGQFDKLLNRASAEWIRGNYMYGFTHFAARNWRNFEKTFSGRVIVPSDPNSPKHYQALVSYFVPKRQSQMLAAQYAAGSPAERWMMIRQSVAAMLNVMQLRNTEEAQQMIHQMTKGAIGPDDMVINGRKAGASLEMYTHPEDNYIQVGDLKMAAAVLPWQLNEGFQLPNLRVLRHMQNRNWFRNLVTNTADGATANAALQGWKVSKTASTPNLVRNLLELGTFTAINDPAVLLELRKGRRATKVGVLQGKVTDNELRRLSTKINSFDPHDLDLLERVRVNQPVQYVATLTELLTKNGFEPGAAEVLANLGQHVDIPSFMGTLSFKGPVRPAWLAMMAPWDTLRQVRAQRLEESAGTLSDTPLEKHLDQELVDALVQVPLTRMGYNAQSGAFSRTDNLINQDRQLVMDAANNGFSYRPNAVNNAFRWATSELTPDLWASQLGARQTDQIGRVTMQLIAHRALARKGIEAKHAAQGGVMPDVDAVTAAQLRSLALEYNIDPRRLGNPDDLVAHLFLDHPWGASMRNDGAAMHYLPDGNFGASNNADRAVASRSAAERATNDLVRNMGGRITRDTHTRVAGIEFPDELEPLLRKLAKGEQVGKTDLMDLPKEVFPEGLVTSLYAPKIPAGPGMMRKFANMTARSYDFMVAKPLLNLGLLPVFHAQKRVAYGHLTPLLEGLVARGYSHADAAGLLETMASRRAMNRVVRSSDDPTNKTVLAEIGEKYFMFMRAQLDFLRRFGQAAVAHPEAIARADILLQAGQHSGVMASQPYQDEDGNTEEKLVFTYPASGLAQRVLSDAGVALGLSPEEMSRIPQFNGFKSQVEWINPSLSNPTGFSLNPVFGMAADVAESFWPSATVDLERIKRGFVYGGQDFEGAEKFYSLRNLLPSQLSRFAPLMTQDDADGQFQSAVRAAMMYSELVGRAPDAGASPSERARFMDEVKATASNVLFARALFGMLAPAAPQAEDPTDPKLLGEDALLRAQGLSNLRSEYFDIRSELSKKYPDNFSRANSEAVMEFAKRHPGELIVNPAAFSVGSTKVSGVEEGYVPYTIAATKWLTANREFVDANPTIAIALMPKLTAEGDFSNEAYKLQLKSDLRTHKDLDKFYDDVTLSDDIGEYYKTSSAYFAAMNGESPAMRSAISNKMNAWQDVWSRTHPLAKQEMDRRADPNYVHATVAPALDRILDGTDPLPASMETYRPHIQEMYDDYQAYRERYQSVNYYNNAGRSNANKAYQAQGDKKWIDTPMAALWDLMRVKEGR